MRAAVLRQPGLPLEIEDVELDAPRAGEPAVRVEAVNEAYAKLTVGGVGRSVVVP